VCGFINKQPPKKQAGDTCIGRSRGGLTSKLHARVVGNGLPVQLELSPDQANDAPMAELLLNNLPEGAVVLADRAYDADWIRDVIEDQDCKACIPPKTNRADDIPYSKRTYKKRNLIEPSSASSSSSGTSVPASTASPSTTWPWSSWLPSDYGSGIVSMQPSHLELKYITL
jgi:transposase